MGRAQGRYDPAPPYPALGQDSDQPIFPPNSMDFTSLRPHTPAASAGAALDVTVHLLQKYNSPSLEASELQKSPLASTSVTIRPVMASTDSLALPHRKLCFVTVGATASFDQLVQAVQAPSFMSALEAAGFTNLLIQHGNAGKTVPTKEAGGVRISSFDFRKDGIQREINSAKGDMRKVKAELKGSKAQIEGLDFGPDWQNATWEEGVVISHAGSGSILDALRVGAPLIVVPNESLLDNHQADLARELAKQGYVVHGRVGKLEQALVAIEAQRQKRKQWPPPPDASDRGGRGLIGIMDEEMGYTDLKSHTKDSRLYLD